MAKSEEGKKDPYEEIHEILNLKTIRLLRDPPFMGGVNKWIEFLTFADKSFECIVSSENPREIVLESWLLVDYCVRNLILSAFDLSSVDISCFDARYDLLPQSHHSCLEILRKLINSYVVTVSDQLEIVRTDEEYSPVHFNVQFFMYLSQHEEDLLNRLEELRKDFTSSNYPNQIIAPSMVPRTNSEFRLNSSWIAFTTNLRDDWFRKAKKLNGARNKAAHTHDHQPILEKLGITGPNSTDLTKKECLSLIEDLIGISLRDESGEKNNDK